jgi:hypothetical protein
MGLRSRCLLCILAVAIFALAGNVGSPSLAKAVHLKRGFIKKQIQRVAD